MTSNGTQLPRGVPAASKVLLTPEEAAYRLSIGRTTIYAAIGTGRLRSVRLGRSRRIPVAALEAFVEELTGD